MVVFRGGIIGTFFHYKLISKQFNMFLNLQWNHVVSGLVYSGIHPSPLILLLILLILHDLAKDNYKLLFHFFRSSFSLSFKFNVIQEGSLSLKSITLFGMEFEKTFIKVLLRVLTCSWIFLLKNKTVQST